MSATIDEIKKYVNKYGLNTKRRGEVEVLNRYYLYAYLKANTKWSLEKIGKVFNRNHTSVLHGLREHNKLMNGPNKVHYMVIVAEATLIFPIDRSITLPSPNSGERLIPVKGENLARLKLIKDSLGPRATYEDAVNYLIKNTIIIA